MPRVRNIAHQAIIAHGHIDTSNNPFVLCHPDSAYNARQCPALHGYDWDAATAAAASGSAPDTIGTTGCGDFTLLQQAQLVTDTMRFFSHEE